MNDRPELDALYNEALVFEGIFNNIRDTRQEIIDQYNDRVAEWNNSWQGNPLGTAFHALEFEEQKKAVEEIWNRIQGTTFESVLGEPCELTGSIMDVADRVFQHHTPVVSLFVTAGKWVGNIKEPGSGVLGKVSNLHAELALVPPLNVLEWTGDVRDDYEGRIMESQKQAILGLSVVSKEMGTWLAEVATANAAFAADMLKHLAAIVEALVGEIGKIVNTAGAGAIWAAAEAVGAIVNEGIEALGTGVNNVADSINRIIDLTGTVNDAPQFRDGNWPPAVTRP